MMEELQRLLATFTEAHGVSGHEEDISRLVAEELAPLVDDVKVDTMGNVIGVRRGDGPSVMMAAHMDEIGLIVKYIDDDGYLRFTTLGGWFDQTLLSQRVVVHGEKGSVPGVIGSKPPHMLEPEERKKVIKIKDMFVDVGAQDADQAAELGLEVGSTITLEQELTPMAADLVCGKSFDDRAGIVMMISALQRVRDEDLKATISAVGTVQEEVGLKGARTSAYAISPDVALVTEVTPAGAHPGVSREQRHIVVGAGPTITVVDSNGRGVIVPKSVLSWLRSSAEDSSLDYQMDVGTGGPLTPQQYTSLRPASPPASSAFPRAISTPLWRYSLCRIWTSVLSCSPKPYARHTDISPYSRTFGGWGAAHRVGAAPHPPYSRNSPRNRSASTCGSAETTRKPLALSNPAGMLTYERGITSACRWPTDEPVRTTTL